MNKYRIAVIFALVYLLAAGVGGQHGRRWQIEAGGYGGEAPDFEGERVTCLIRSLKLRGKKVIDLGQDAQLPIRGKDGVVRQAPATLVVKWYDSQWVELVEGGVEVRKRSLTCYELRAEGDPLFSWCMWKSYMSQGHFRLCSDKWGNVFLAWVDVSDVYFAEVRDGNDMAESLTEYWIAVSKAKPVEHVRVRVRDLIPESRSWGVNALYSDMLIESVAKEPDGRITIRIRGPDKPLAVEFRPSDKVHTLVFDGKEWRREE